MRIDFTKELKAIDGSVLKHADESKPMTLQDVAVVGLVNIQTTSAMQSMPAEAVFSLKARAWKLASKIQNSPNDCEVEAAEIVAIKAAIGPVFGAAVCGPVEMLLEGGAVIAPTE